MSSAAMWICCRLISNRAKCKNYYFLPVRKHWRYTASVKESSPIKYALVLDFEATCSDSNKITQEIIEFPCLKMNINTLSVDDTFHEYVRPVVNPELTDFCVDLTGILQEMVDTADPFPNVLNRFLEWRNFNGLTVENSVYVTSGDWDLGRMLPNQCDLCGIPIPQDMYSWIDLKKFYMRATGFMPKSLREALTKSGLLFQGRQHSGIDDCLNIANVLRKLAHHDYSPTSQLAKSLNGYRVISYPDL